MWAKAFPWVHRVFRPWSGTRPRVEIKRGSEGKLLVLISGQLATLTHPETLSALKASGSPVVRALCQVLESGSIDARLDAAWLLGQLGSETSIPALTQVIEAASSGEEAPLMLRRTTEALLRLGPAGIQAFDRAMRIWAPDDLIRLLLIRHATEQLLGTSSPPPLSPAIATAWRWALTVYLRRIEWIDRLRRAEKLSSERVVLEAYGVSLEEDRQTVPKLIEALNRFPAHATDQSKRAS